MFKKNAYQSKLSARAKMAEAIKLALPKAYATTKWLLSIMLPVSFGVMILNYTGILSMLSSYLSPAFELIGLPGESAFVLLTSIFTNIYTAIAVISSLGLDGRVVTILAVMCLVSHGFIIETAVLRKTGSSVVRMILLRLFGSFILGAVLNSLLPAEVNHSITKLNVGSQSFSEMFIAWCNSSLVLTLKVIVLISLLMIFQKILELFGIIKWISKILQPFQIIMGLPESTSFSWIVANTLGLAYGSAIIMEQVDEGKMSKKDADLLNHHIAVSHSQLEDPLLFAAIGVPLGWMIVPRLLLGILVVWLCRFEKYLRLKIGISKVQV